MAQIAGWKFDIGQTILTKRRKEPQIAQISQIKITPMCAIGEICGFKKTRY